ncbi:hypothetical protein OR60_18300, partial [Xanthomonas vesicatoria]|uniref:hypothetical protein n=1 Tax=Xanthomonas vesicatoria TaxID=56460 RepID=UPI0005740C01
MTRPTLSVIGLAIAAALSTNAQAQQADPGATTLDTVIVTGTVDSSTVRSLARVPVTITVSRVVAPG